MCAAITLALLAGSALSGPLLPDGHARGQAVAVAPSVNAVAAVAAPPQRQPPSIAQALEQGVLIVISTSSQRMEVFKDGQPWLTSPVSTGRRGHGTPSGVFPILEKQQFHRSNIYSNAPMPFMQRLTMGGIALHAGHLPGYPASHGCIRLPYGTARSLFGLTRARDTIVVIVKDAMQSDDQVRRLALAMERPQPGREATVRLAYAATLAAPPPAPAQPNPAAGQTIQLAAALSPREAEAQWIALLGLHAELGRFDKAVVPVVVGSRRYFRLRASGPGAFATCAQLRGAGLDCFKVL